ncbi:glycosyltransferase family 4 protein [Paenirhodobacter sp.]|uniref:glycosyltransferase family 4 protein n=1 Tax=Paenirhodobacter sp. TaxID=1965326 RepID=UPI003B400EDE
MTGAEHRGHMAPLNVAMLLSCTSFEGFFGNVLGQSRQRYLDTYRGDWAWYYAAGLRQNGVAPVLYVPALNESGRHETDTGIAVRFLPLARWYRPFERVWLKRLLRQSRYALYADERLNAHALMAPLRAALAEDRIDLLYVQEYWSGRFDHLVHRAGIPVAGADHGGLAATAMTGFKRPAFARAAVLYSQTPDECASVREWGGVPTLQPNGCDTAFFCPDPAVQRSKTILTIARLTNRQKRISDLIDALARLPRDWTLDIVGTGPDRGMLERQVARLGLGGRVRWHGFLGREAVRERLRRCGVYVMASSNEAVAIAALEAMGCGCAMVLSRIRAFEHLVQDGISGRLVPVRDPDALAAAIEEGWVHREIWGQAATHRVRTRFDTRLLYGDLAQSLRQAAHAG